jgi:hypothetical protein
MSNEDFQSAIDQFDSIAPTLATTSLDADPEQATRALALSRATGAPPLVVYDDIEGFENEHRAKLTAGIVSGNDQLAAYLRGHPLADVVSNDDYGNMDNFSRTVPSQEWLKEVSPLSKALGAVVVGGVRGAMVGATEGVTAPFPEEDLAGFDKVPEELQTVAKFTYLNTIDLSKRVMAAISGLMMGGAKGAARELGETFGASETGIGQIERDIDTGFEALMGHAGHVEPWIAAGIEPPRGLHPEIDRLKAEVNFATVEQLNENLQAAQQMLTKERDLPSAQAFFRQHYEEATLGISGDRFLDLYGGRIPTPDDGILGWIPDLEAQLKAASLGEDVHIPIADWMTHVDPALASELMEDIRVWPGGITKREAAEVWEPKAVVDSPLAQARAAFGTEPLFSQIGDRKLELKQLASAEGFEEFHEYQFLNEAGQPVGELTIVPDPAKKTLYVANINGLAGLYSNSFGPSLVRDLKRQLKALYPEYETITGHRVSGAREKAGVWEDAEKSHPTVKLSAPEGWDKVELGMQEDFQNFRKIFESKYAEQFSQGERKNYGIFGTPEGDTMLLPPVVDEATGRVTRPLEPLGQARPLADVMGEKYHAIDLSNDSMLDIAARAMAQVFDHLNLGELRTYYTTHEDSHFPFAGGFYNPVDPAVVVRKGTPRFELMTVIHEGAHAAFYHAIQTKPEVKATLDVMMDHVRNHFGITDFKSKGRDFYGMTDPHEFVSEAFSNPRFQKILKDIPIDETFLRLKGIGFSKTIKTAWDWFLDSVRKAFGMEDNPQSRSVLEAVIAYGHQLEQAANETIPAGGKIVESEAARPMFSAGEDVASQLSRIRATVAGLDKKTFEKLQNILHARHAEDLAAAMKRAEKNQKKIQSAEWKKQTEEIAKEVEATINQRPDVAADMLIGRGELDGKQIQQRVPIFEGDLTEAQKATLPKWYYSKTGVRTDEVAALFGFPSGDAMVKALGDYHAKFGDLSARERRDALVKEQTEKRMAAVYGSLDATIMREATDQALSETNLNLVAEEWQAAAMQAGISVIGKDEAKAYAIDVFSKLRVGDVSVDRLQTQMQRHYRAAVDALIKGDPAGAVVRLQRRYEISLLTAEAKKLEKTQASLERTAKQFKKREVPSAEPEYVDFIHDILSRVGFKVSRTAADIAKEIDGRGYTGLEHFVQTKSAQFRELAVWPELFDPRWTKPVEAMTVEEFRAVADSIKSLVWNAKDERKIYKAGEAADLAEIKKGLIEGVADSAQDKIAKEPATAPGKLLKNYYVSSLQMETIFRRWDRFDPKGLWNQYVMRDLVDGANQVDAWKKEYAKKIADLPEPKDLSKQIDNPLFFDPDTDVPLDFTRKNLIAVMLNTGTGTGKRSNLYKLAKGYKIEMDDIMAWVHAHATKEDWDFVRGMWDIFADIKVKSDTMYRSLSGGVPAADLPPYPVMTPFGEVKGGYFPILWHRDFEGKSQKLMGRDPLEQSGYFRATTPAGYTETRTGYAAPMALDLDQIPGRISQMLQDIGLRPAVINASKIFYDHDVRSAVRKHYGAEYREQFVDYLQAVANSANNMNVSQRALVAASEFVRQNMITTLVGLNPGTVLKHGPTAAVLSMKEVGPANFLKAVHSMFRVSEETAETNWQFAIKNSLELQRRDRNWEETLYGATQGLVPGEKFAPWRAKIMEWASKPVAMSDMISAVPTWLAAYEKEMNATGVHGDAVYAADLAVRRAHGSTAITNRPAIVRNTNPWLTSVYNFFSDIMNRQVETIWRAGEIEGHVKEGDFKKASAATGAAIAGMFAYAVWPAIVEHMVSGEGSEEKESWGAMAAKAGVRTAASSWIGVRDFANWMLYGFDPQFGMGGTAMKALGSAFKDLGKDHPLRKDHRGKLLQDGATMIGAMTGAFPAQLGRSARYLHDVEYGLARPKGPWEWLVGLRYGTTKGHTRTFEDYTKGKVRK